MHHRPTGQRLATRLLLGAALCGPWSAALAQGLPAGERARGESRCPAGHVGEAVPGGFRCVRPDLAAAPPTAQGQAPAGAAGGQAREVSRGLLVTPWLFGAGALAVVGAGVAAASQGGSSPSNTR